MLVFSLLLLALVLYLTIQPLRNRQQLNRFKRIKSLENNYKSVIEKSFPYYNNLSDENKTEFERRLQFFISIKSFYTFDNLDLTDEMVVLTSASAIQLMFGFKQFWLPNVKVIYIFPAAFQRYENMPKFRGEYTEKGIIRLSWQHFEQGYLQPRDGINLGLHEMAHALMSLNELEFFNEFDKDLDQYKHLAATELYRIRNRENEFLRAYAGTNVYEMFAVCVEYFFEVPDLFQQELPKLYESLSKLLNQNPVNATNPVWVR